MFADFERTRVDVEGATIDLLRGGDGPPVVCLHGHPQTRAAWHEIAPQLAEEFTVVVPDLRGYGDSRGPTDSTTAEYANRTMAADVVAVMASLGFDAFRLVGHGRGARLGYRCALDHPDRVRKLAHSTSCRRSKRPR